MYRESYTDSRKKRRVHFRLEACEAEQVYLVIKLNHFENRTYPMNREDGSDLWTKILVLPPGRYQYTFSVDGRWVNDPENTRKLSRPGGMDINECLVYLPTTKEL